MNETENEPIEAPATWENVVVGKAKHLVGRILGDDELTEAGDEQEKLAHEVRDEFEEEQPS